MANYRYNIDGTLREETEAERIERESRFSKRGRSFQAPAHPPPSKADALEAAKRSLAPGAQASSSTYARQSSSSAGTKYESGPLPWSQQVDRLLFGRGGEAPFRRSSEQFEEFRVESIEEGAGVYLQYFYSKYLKVLARKQKSGSQPESDIETARHVLVLFQDFQEKKRKTLKAKIEKDRANLPIKAYKSAIVDAVRKNRVVLIAADTGAGKSTQVPQYLLAGGFDRIACTQPRRIACYSLARRVSYETQDEYGSEIAYQVRFEGTKTQKTRVLFLTEGVLLRQFASDPRLGMYDTIIIDEVHERHVTDIKIVLMSATINAELFSRYFQAPVIEIPGRMYPVKIEYLPIEPEDRNLVDESLYKERMQAEVRRSVAVFDIAPEGVRKCILSTNIAETSVTIDGVRFIIDSGKDDVKSKTARYTHSE
ncbi:DEAH (Asp-Glu-Ala-His) box polypeptide 34 [Quaeritorhiza haematococci]|nr:DEAH (Asp-Glu-Ala-His) box polypeptide 34 [Quaeritorhiza haematococci]